MATLADIKDDYAQKLGFDDWEDFLIEEKDDIEEHVLNDICKSYAKTKLIEASINAKIKWPLIKHREVDRESITNTPLD